MLEAGVAGAWIDNRCQPQLVDAVQALYERMLYDVIKQSAWYLDEPEYRVVDNLRFVHPSVVSFVFSFW